MTKSPLILDEHDPDFDEARLFEAVSRSRILIPLDQAGDLIARGASLHFALDPDSHYGRPTWRIAVIDGDGVIHVIRYKHSNRPFKVRKPSSIYCIAAEFGVPKITMPIPTTAGL